MSHEPSAGPNDESPDWDALARYLFDESPPQEVKRVQAWLAAHPAEQTRIAALGDRLSRLRVVTGQPVDTEAALRAVLAHRDRAVAEQTSARGQGTARTSRLRQMLAIAASLLMVAAGMQWMMSRDGPPELLAAAQHVETSVGQIDSIRLADGSLAVLGPKSSITISPDFGGAERRISLEGQGYFEVVHDDRRPFAVHTGSVIVRDAGTAFAVQPGAGGGVVVAVASGVVELRDSSASAAARPFILRANQAAIMKNGTAHLTSGSVTTSNALEWMQRRLRFQEAPMSAVAAELGRWYGLELQFADSSLLTRHLTASFDGEPASQILAVIGLALDADLVRTGDVVTVRAHR
jgi:transmembrane sensor